MPLYLYACRTCALEYEELYSIGQAPAQSIQCPLCGGYFERGVAMFNVGGRREAIRTASSDSDASSPLSSDVETGGVRHGVDCFCCARPARPSLRE